MIRAGHSLQWRLGWRLALIVALAIGVTFAVLVYRTFTTASDLRDQSLQGQAADIAKQLQFREDGTMRLVLPPHLQSLYHRQENEFFFAVFGPGDRVIATSSARLGAVFAPYIPSGTAARFFRVEAAAPHGPYLGYITSAKGLRIVVAQGRSHGDVLMDSLFNEYLASTLWWVLPIILAMIWIGVGTVRRSLAPLEALSAEAQEIGPATTDRRLPEDGMPREVTPLVHAFNGALDRLDRGFAAQRRLTADAAHQLRTPVAVLQARLDSAGEEGPDLDGLRRDVSKLHRLVVQLLRLARLDSTRPRLDEKVDLHALARDTLSEMVPLAVRHGREIALEAVPAPVGVRGNRALLAEALGNLVENAVRHTPQGTTVTVRIGVDGAIEVLDRGPGIPEESRSAIFERFWRAPGADGEGAGLGLAIVADIARLHGGGIEVAPRPGGGTVFRLVLPPLSPAGPGPGVAASAESATT